MRLTDALMFVRSVTIVDGHQDISRCTLLTQAAIQCGPLQTLMDPRSLPVESSRLQSLYIWGGLPSPFVGTLALWPELKKLAIHLAFNATVDAVLDKSTLEELTLVVPDSVQAACLLTSLFARLVAGGNTALPKLHTIRLFCDQGFSGSVLTQHLVGYWIVTCISKAVTGKDGDNGKRSAPFHVIVYDEMPGVSEEHNNVMRSVRYVANALNVVGVPGAKCSDYLSVRDKISAKTEHW